LLASPFLSDSTSHSYWNTCPSRFAIFANTQGCLDVFPATEGEPCADGNVFEGHFHISALRVRCPNLKFIGL
jgi:hypothetical protein